ncbi:OsmC/Ohr family [Gymnopilus junonius]|uniref:OsmC/Ohr family n=1 Tax=Gymnopilus junonius TaxID=109634 RepID=A0A9P5TR24_GYMJU|nr:OsmC/Ohr family [Gymnopilus junonius]
MFAPAARTLLASSIRSGASRRTPSALKLSYGASRTVITLKEVKYTANAVASGAGRNGARGTGKGENPEQLFAMGYSACLLGAIQAMARKQGKTEMAKNAKVYTSVNIGEPNGLPGFGLSVDIKVEGVDDELLKAGHEFCPYSRALGQGAVVTISKA